MFTWPNELDDAGHLLGLVGSFWANTFQGNDLVASLLHARAQVAAQEHLDLLELIASLSRFNVPVFHKQNWHLLSLRESEVNRAEANFARFDGAFAFDGEIAYDVPQGTPFYVWPVPAGLAKARVVLSTITRSKVAWAAGVDFFLKDGAIWLRQNPFDVDAVPKREVFKDGQVVDRECGLWVYRGDWDWNTVYEQFAYAVGVRAPSGQNVKDLGNAVYDGLVEGTTERCLRQAFSAITDVPLAADDETVERVLEDRRKLWVITDRNVYGYAKGSRPLVEPGDAVRRGDSLVDTVQFFEFNRGQVPNEIRALAVGKGLLAEGYFQDLVFENKEVPLLVDADGPLTKATFEVGGMPADVEKFWDDVHAEGVRRGKTLARLLDQRPAEARDTEPTAVALPKTVNPLGFLLQNVFRNNAFVVKLRSSLFGRKALGLHHARVLRRLVPPQSACIVLVELEYRGDVIMMDGPGDDARAGYEESARVFLGNTISEEMDPADYLEETVRCTQLGGRCQ